MEHCSTQYVVRTYRTDTKYKIQMMEDNGLKIKLLHIIIDVEVSDTME